MSSQAAASSGLLTRLAQIVFAGPYEGGRATAALLVRLAAGVVLVIFGIGKFVIYDEEVVSFTRYGLPAPEVIVYVIGVVELVGGLLFLAGLVTRPAALMIVGNMLGAIVTSGILKGETISLTLAPALFLGACFLVWAGGGRASVDERIARRTRGTATGRSP